MRKINVKELKDFLKELPKIDLLIADVRNQNAFNTWHVDNMDNIPIIDLEEQKKKILLFDKVIVFSDSSDEVSKACEILDHIHPHNLMSISISYDEINQEGIRLIANGGTS